MQRDSCSTILYKVSNYPRMFMFWEVIIDEHGTQPNVEYTSTDKDHGTQTNGGHASTDNELKYLQLKCIKSKELHIFRIKSISL